MEFVFRVLSSEVKDNIHTTKSGKTYYEIPLSYKKEGRNRSCTLIVPSQKTYKKGDSLYIVLNSKSNSKDLLLILNKTLEITDNDALDLINKDYINYIMDKDYNHKMSHAVNHLMPIGTKRIGEDGEIEIDRWSQQIALLLERYGKDFIAINPIINNSLYPFHYVNFLEHKYVREYRSNLIMFSLLYGNKDYQYHNKKIYYLAEEDIIMMYEVINDESFYSICDEKDKINKATTPFLKSFNDHGLDKEVIEFMKYDEIYVARIKNIYGQLRAEMRLDEDKVKKYFIPALKSTHAIKIRKLKEQGNEITNEENEILQISNSERMEKLISLYEKNSIFYFTSEDLIITDDNITINSALKRIVQMDIDELDYDEQTRIVYNIRDYNGKDLYTPILEVITKEELKELQEQIYRMWIEGKKKKSR